ncbi:MAG: HAD-IC family P-type ATPase, partial [Pseudomonadota bacterium]
AEAVARAWVFARVEPVQKLTIVRALQDRGHFVAVTGDGVNDAPALHAAHIGVAMGRDGTDVARAAADLIVADDNFASIVNGVEEGRVAYDNVRKVIYLLVSCGLAEIVVFAVSLWWGLPLPLFATQLLWLNLVTDGIHPVALALEKGDPDILKRPPRPPEQPIFDRRMLEQSFISGLLMGVLAAYAFRVMLESGMNEASARNMVFLLLVLFENVHFHNCSSETRSIFHRSNWRNRLTVLAPPLALTVHIAATWTPGLREVLHAEPVTAEMVLTLLPVALVAVVVMEAYKWWVRRRAA